MYVISKNIHRRHLTKEQQAELIIKALKARIDLANMSRSKTDSARTFNPNAGEKGGSTKDRVKEEAVKEAKKHGIGKRTVERAFAKDRGTAQPKEEKEGAPRKPSEQAVKESVFRKTISEKDHEIERFRKQVEDGVQKRAKLIDKIDTQQRKIQELERDLRAVRAENKRLKNRPSFFGYEAVSSSDEAHRVYRKLSKKYHPDHNGNSSGDTMKDINELWDAVKKAS